MFDFLSLIKNFKNITIVCHPNADPDSLGAAYALFSFLKFFGKVAKIYTPESINSISRQLLEYLEIDPIMELPESDLFILVDVSSLDQILSLKHYIEKNKVPYVIIDHHISDVRTLDRAKLAIIEDSSSTCEIVYKIIKDYPIDRKSLEALLTGIVYDSRRFLIKPKSSFLYACELINRGADLERVLQFLTPELDFSEKIARLKGCARVRLFRISSWIIAITHVGAFEASVARSLVDIGADIAFVVNTTNECMRITGRVSDSFYHKTGFNLVEDIIKPLTKSFIGQGGGHATAATVNLFNVDEAPISKLLDLILNKLNLPKSSLLEIDIKK